jgi:uncharacterized protein Yka (UPF0111/DUF47 family)
MTAAAPIFDRLLYVQRLRSAGIDEQQAIAQADALDGAFRESVATKADVAEVKAEIQQIDHRIDVLEANVKAMIAEVKTEIAPIKWATYAMAAGITALIVKAFFG